MVCGQSDQQIMSAFLQSFIARQVEFAYLLKPMQVKCLIILTAIAAAFTGTAAEAASTQWQDLGGGRARLVAELDAQSLEVTAMLEMELEPGWKTYWREPGGSGIPPQFDFSASRHFLPGEISFPVPRRLMAGGVVFAGYQDSVRFLIDGRFTADSEDGEIALDLLAGVCEEICIPATASFRIAFADLLGSDPAAAGALALAAESLPEPASADFSITGAALDADGGLVVEARVPEGDGEPALFAEGPAGWALAPAKLVSTDGRSATFRLGLGGIPGDADPGAEMLRYTLVKGDRGVEQWLSSKDAKR
jgi:DsbC/DsbD-like thiol-disulfide interchange protein